MEDSPPPFIVFRSPRPAPADVYQLALDATALVASLVGRLPALPLCKQLDERATKIAMLVGAGVADLAPAGRRQTFRTAQALATACVTMLDILARRPDVALVVVRPVQRAFTQLVDQLARHSV